VEHIAHAAASRLGRRTKGRIQNMHKN